MVILFWRWQDPNFCTTEEVNPHGLLVELNNEVIFLTGFYNATIHKVTVFSTMRVGMIS